MDTAMSDESTGKPQLGTCRTRYGDSPHVKCYDCLDWRPVAAQPLVPATEGQLLGPQKHLETCAACNHGRTPCEEYKRNYGKPTSEEINALPKRIRDFIMELETNADPAGTIREVGMLRDQVAQLSAALAESQQANGEQELQKVWGCPRCWHSHLGVVKCGVDSCECQYSYVEGISADGLEAKCRAISERVSQEFDEHFPDSAIATAFAAFIRAREAQVRREALEELKDLYMANFDGVEAVPESAIDALLRVLAAQPTEELREHPRDSYGEVQASISGPALDAQREKFDWKWAERVLECDCDSGIYDNQVCDKCQLLAALRSALADADSRTTAAARTDSVKVRHAFLSIENLAHQAWTDKKNIRQLFERIEKIAIEQGRALSPSSSTKADRCLKNTGTGRSAT
jgi:hypothetical protein